MTWLKVDKVALIWALTWLGCNVYSPRSREEPLDYTPPLEMAGKLLLHIFSQKEGIVWRWGCHSKEWLVNFEQKQFSTRSHWWAVTWEELKASCRFCHLSQNVTIKTKSLWSQRLLFFLKKISVKYSFYTSIFFCKFGLRIAKDTSEFDLSLWQTGRYDIEKLTGRMLVQIPRDWGKYRSNIGLIVKWVLPARCRSSRYFHSELDQGPRCLLAMKSSLFQLRNSYSL